MTSPRRLPPAPAPLALRLAGLAALALFGITCRDRDPMGPGLPSQASLAVAPQMQRAALAGGPSFLSMRSVHGVLTPIGGGASYAADAAFEGDSATLEFNVTFAGPTQRYSLALAATDTAGDTLFRSMREVVATPGSNDPVSDVMTYVAPDTGVRTILLAADSLVLSGDSIAISATGLDAKQAAVTPLYIGWTSRDTNVARVIATGPASGRVIGKSIESPVWIVGRAFNGVADSVSVRVALKVGSVLLSADTVHLPQGGITTAQATVLDASGAAIDRPVTFTSLDTTILTVTIPLGAAAQATVASQATVAPQVTQLVGVRAGTTKLVAASGGKTDTAVVVVDPPAVATVRIIPDSIALNPGDSARFGVLLLSAAGDTLTGRTVSWTTGSSLVSTVSVSGTVRAVAAGRTFVTATSEGVVDTAWVNVMTTGTSIVRTVVSPKTLHLVALGEKAQLVAQGYAGDSSLVPGRYTWTVRQALPLLSVDSLGGVTALAVGSAWVVATEKGGTADSAQVTIDQLVQTVQITPARASGAVGDTIHFTATAIDGRGNAIDYGTAVWSNLERFVTTLDATGAAVLAEPGLDTVSVTINGLTAHAEVNVYSPASAVTISGRTSFAALRDTAILHATALDRAQKPIAGASFEWASDNPAVVAISSVGGDSAVVVSQGNGSARVIATVGTASAAAPLAVSQQGKGAMLAPATASLSPGGRAIFTPMLLDATGVAIPLDAGEKVTWGLSSAADSAIVQVDGNGEVVANGGQGTATVSAIVRGIAATATVTISDTAKRQVSFGRDTILVGLDTVQVPVILSAPAGGSGLVVALGTDSSAARWVGDTVRFGATETIQYAKLTGGEAGSSALTASEVTGLYAGGTATGVVRASARFADFWLTPVDTLHVNASDDVPLRVVMRDPAPNGGASLDLLAEGPAGIATVAPAPFTIPGGQMVADVVMHAGAPGTMRYTPLTRGLPGTGSTFVIDSALLTLQVDTSNNGCDGPCSVQAKTSSTGRHVSPTTPYNAPQRTTASRAVLAQQRRATEAVRIAASTSSTIAKASGQFYYPPPGDPHNIILGAGQYLPTSGSRGACYYRCGAVLSLPNRTFAGVRATLTVDDPAIARAEEAATIPLDYEETFLNVSALAVGTTVLRARAADWREAALNVTVTTPRLIAVANGDYSAAGNVYTLRGGLQGDSIDVLVADSLMIAHPRLSSLAVHASSSAPSVIDVRDSLVVVAPGEAQTAVFLVARGAGTAWIRVWAGGHVADSVAVRAEAARMYGDSQVVYVGAGQMRDGGIPVQLTQPTTHTVSAVVRSLDPSVLAIRDSAFTIAPGSLYPRNSPSSATLVGTAPGAGRVVIEADSGFAPETLSVVVTSPYVGVYVPDGTVGVASSVYVISEDSVGNWNTSANPAGLDSIHVVSADSTIIAVDTVVAIPAGAQYLVFNATPRRPGTVALTASRSGYRTADPIPTTVSGALLSAGIACDIYYSCPSNLTGVGLRSGPQDARVGVNTATTRDVVVRFAGAKNVQLPDSVVIPAGGTEVRFGWNGLAIGTDSITVTADSGYNPATLVLGSGATTISAELNGNYNWAPDSIVTGTSLPLVIRLYDPSFTQRQPTNPVAFLVTPSDSKIIAPDSAAIHLSVDLTQTQTTYVQYVQEGKASLTVSDSAGLFTPMTLGPTVVHRPALRFAQSSYSVGMRQTVDVTVMLPTGVMGTEVRLRSSDDRIAKAIVDLDTTNVYPYDQATFTVEAYDTTGTVQLTATTSDGTDKGTVALTVTRGVLSMYVPSDPSLLDQETPNVSLLDEFGWQHPTSVPLALTITSSHPDVVGPSPIALTVQAGASQATADLSLSFLRTGMSTLTVRDGQTGYRAYRPAVDTVVVRRAELYTYDDEVRLAPGQHYQMDAGLAQMSNGTEKAHFDVRPGKSIALIPDQVLGGGLWDLYYDVVATAPGIDTVIVQVDGYAPARALVRVGEGTISFDNQGGIPDSLVAGDSVAVALTAYGPEGYLYPQADTATFSIAYGGTGVIATDGTSTLSAVQVAPGGTSTPTFWIKATGAAGSVGDVVFSRPGYGSYRARVRVVAGALPVAVAVTPRTLP